MTSESHTNNQPPNQLYVTERQAAHKIGVSVKALQAWRLRGCGPAFIRISSRCVRYSISDVDLWMAARRVSSTSEPCPGPAVQSTPGKARRVK